MGCTVLASFSAKVTLSHHTLTCYSLARTDAEVFRSVNIKALALTLAGLAAWPVFAEPPTVATDIPPVHSLVARVMQGLGEPRLVLPPGASPHGYSMRPSEAATLAEAGVVVWTGAALTPWLERAIGTLAPHAITVELLETDGTTLLGFREGATFEASDSAGEEQQAHADDHSHMHGGIDPHAWLDPENAKNWLDAVAAALSRADPANAEAYARNAADGRADLDTLMGEIADTLAPVRGRAFFVFHDAYHYFEHRFRIEAAGALALGDASSPGPARISAIRAAIDDAGARCVFTEPQFAPDLVETVVEGNETRVATLDPLGGTLTPGPELYPKMLRRLADKLRDCLDPAA